jgi:hypothetical protein
LRWGAREVILKEMSLFRLLAAEIIDEYLLKKGK